ncbi:MAG: T9SS type A sorting domain-containing protein [Bacteroidaceae bacterium]|nr:T9SS type A sorting domain-containing protein [Bacteroidaceae bacterium]
MREIYKKISVATLCLLVAMSAAAQTAYILNGSSNRKVNEGKCAIYAFDVKTPWVANEVCYADTTSGCFGVLGTLADSIYYAYMETETESGATTNMFCSLNMTTGNKVILGKSFDLAFAIDMCYDEGTKTIYLLRKEFVVTDEETGDGKYMMELCTVNPSNGRMTTFATLPEEATDYKIAGITPDGNGNLYMVGMAPYTPKAGENSMFKFWYKQMNLYSFNLSTKELTEVFVDESTAKVKLTTDFMTSSLALHEGVLYQTIQSHLITLDIATKTATLITEKGSGDAGADNAKLLLGEGVGICFAKSTADAVAVEEEPTPEPTPDTRMVKVVETYGDHMGERVGQITHKKVSLYDGENRLQREATYGLSYTNVWEIEYFGTCTYNEAGQLAMTASQKYGIHDGTDLGFIDNNDTITYTYDEAGRLVRETMQAAGYSMAYEYNEAGQKVKEIKLVPDYYNQYEGDEYVMYEITYSAFNAYGQPDSIHSTGMYDNDKYFGVYTYDEQGRKTSAHTWTLADTTDVKIETWSYNDDAANDTVMVHWVHEWFWGFDQGEKRAIYTYDNGNVNRTKEQVQTLAANGAWVNESTYTITELSEMNPEAVATLEVIDGRDVNSVLETNSAALVITLPDAAVTGTIAFDIYRHGIFLTRLNATDAKEGKLTYFDEGVKNGTYDYYVQTVLINELLETEDALNISDVETYVFNTYLPKVRDIRCVSARLEGGVYYATIEWNAPIFGEVEEGSPWIGHAFQRYNVMLEKMKAADNLETDGQALTWEVNCGYTGKVNLYVQTVYKYGKANSEMISIDCQAVMDAMGIEGTGAEAQVTVRGGIVSAAVPARLVAYNAQGAVVAEAVNTLDLNTLPAGIYLVKVETAEGVKTVKVRL